MTYRTAQSGQFLVADQPSEYRAQHAFDLRERFFEAQRLAVDFDLIESCARQHAPDIRGKNLVGLLVEAPDLVSSFFSPMDRSRAGVTILATRSVVLRLSVQSHFKARPSFQEG